MIFCAILNIYKEKSVKARKQNNLYFLGRTEAMKKVMTVSDAIKTYIKDGSTVSFAGFVGSAHAEEVSSAIEQEYLATGSPKDLTVVYSAGIGDSKDKGLNHLGVEGLVSKVIGGHWGLVPKLQKLAFENKIAAYNIPQGVISQMYRDIAAGKPGVLTHVGLKTYVDPRLEGGKINDKAREAGDIVELIHIGGKEKLLYHAIPIDVAVLRATYADTHGNCTMEREGITLDAVSIAQAAKNSGGKVIVQVERVVEYGSWDPRKVKIPGIYVDAVVVGKPENHMQTYGTQYNPAFSGEARVPMDSIPALPLDVRKVISRRAAMELVPNAIVNLGIGMPEGVAAIAAEENISGMVLTAESGVIGGIPAGGNDFGVTTNAECVLDQPYQFDFYDGGGLDVAFLGLAEMDGDGNINVSRFGTKLPGCGGFINNHPEFQESCILRYLHCRRLKGCSRGWEIGDSAGRQRQEACKAGRADHLQWRLCKRDRSEGLLHHRKSCI